MEYYHQCNYYIQDIRYKELTEFSLIGVAPITQVTDNKNSNIQGR